MSSQPHPPQLLKAAILIISDTAFKDPSTDKAAAALEEVFETKGAGKWQLAKDDRAAVSDGIAVKIVPDQKELIQNAIIAWTDGDTFMNLIVTTGGTGFTPRDNTPEAVTPLLHRLAPGLVHGMLAASLEVTPFAMMSRPVAGVRNNTIIITLPGSPKGAKENLQAVLKLLPHACTQAAGENSRIAHAGGTQRLEKEAGVSAGPARSKEPHTHTHNHDHSHSHSHNHSHGHGGHQVPKAHTNPSERPPQSNDPRLGASHRARQSPYPMLSVAEAVAKILENTPSPTPETRPLSTNLVGCILSCDITAAEAVPAYRASIVDGYAVIIPTEESQRHLTKGTFPVASVSHAQASSMPPPLQPGTIARITTGAPLPANANSVVMVEDTTIASLTSPEFGDDASSTPEEKTVTILTDALSPGENIREPGSDIAPNSTILPTNTRITSLGGEIGLLAASGTRQVPVYRRPRLGVLSTGDEVTDISRPGPLTGGMIRDSNRPSLLTLISSWQLCDEVVDLGIARDTPHSELETKLRDAYGLHDLDIVVTTGGVSMGELDLLKPTIERSLGGTIHFGRVNMKPGKPTTFASIPVKGTENRSDSDASQRTQRLIFALPGNPASALVTANLFLLPSLQKFAGVADPKGLERVRVRLAGDVKCDRARPEYHRCVVGMDGASGLLVATSTGMQRSSRVGSVGGANGLLCLPAREGALEAGETCECLMMGMVNGF
ncbi:hypothetical protein LTR70_001097 [Exophiala xenobiotica]|uniref:MoaB/Mog domain-containing protein n=1 Tax=Lithohypha guttulata TaxID=1690604 RepID=A0ABR0KPT2_9EURO|nr:hypothetical protein LTR24_000713 [Lithohypha guttulata]KAK5328943.1 hypothetical protein LTR70_001097 [Exophiala xenobiotica]